MCLNIGCGIRMLEGYCNIDIQQHPDAPRAPDLLCDAKAIPLPDACADEILAVHVFEHFHRWQSEAVLDEWCRLLRPGGLLVLELPDLIKCCQNIISGRAGKHPDQLGRWGIYGDPRLEDPYMCHPWGWAPKELAALLKQHGFASVQHVPTRFHAAGRDHRDMRLEARKA